MLDAQYAKEEICSDSVERVEALAKKSGETAESEKCYSAPTEDSASSSDEDFHCEEPSEEDLDCEEPSDEDFDSEESSEVSFGANIQCEEQYPEDQSDIAALRKWAIDTGIAQTHLDSLLGILRRRLLPQLPKSSKTFLKTTSASYEIENFTNADSTTAGQFVYFGIAHHLQRCVNPDVNVENIIFLQFNIDGLSLFKSSDQQLWPILCKVFFEPDVYQPFPVAIYSGNGKPPDVDKYFEKFIAEISDLRRHGITIENRVLEIRIMCFICDRPARSFVKCIINHGGYYACERCTIQGERCDKRTVYVATTCEKRTSETFHDQTQAQHHSGISPLTSIVGLNMIQHFVLDFMHLCCLGVMKKFLNYWLSGNRKFKISQNASARLSQLLLDIQSQVPQDFQRTTRSLNQIAKWKGTEFRLFLLYLAPVVLKKVLPVELYRHFLLFHTSCRILCSESTAQRFNDQARVYLTRFVKLTEQYYGKKSQILNVHSLIHLADDAKSMGCSLNKITAFPFESALGKLKKMVRSGRNPLSQISRRYHEAFVVGNNKTTLPPAVIILNKKYVEGEGMRKIKKLRYADAILTNKSPDNVVLLQNKQILQIDVMYIAHQDDQENIKITGKVLSPEKPIFEYPSNSQILDMCKAKTTNVLKTCALQDISCKMVCFKIHDGLEGTKIYCMPLLHQ